MKERSIFEVAREAKLQVARWPAWKAGVEKCPVERCERGVGHLAHVPHGFSSFVEWADGATPPPVGEIVGTAVNEDATAIRFSLLELE